MCTAITFKPNDHYFGRNLDLEYSLNESVIIAPRNFPFSYQCEKPMLTHLGIIGIGIISDNYPLYYDATNEAGLSVAGLNFPENAIYFDPKPLVQNITPFEFIPWILGQCKTVSEARALLNNTAIVNIPFSQEYPLTPLHWIIADRNESITVESVANGLMVYDNPVGILANNPPFEYHLQHLCQYLNLTSEEATNRFSKELNLSPYSRGMGAIGLPGDLSSSSRFVKAAFTKLNSVYDDSESANVSQFFHILSSVAQTKGCVRVGDKYERTVYSSCCNTDKGLYYYTTYENSQVSCVDLHNEDLDADILTSYPMIRELQIQMVNGKCCD